MPNYTCATCGERITTKAEEDWHIYTHLQAFNGSDYSEKIAKAAAEIKAGTGNNVQGANITYLRWRGRGIDSRISDALAIEIERACNDIESYREIMGLLLSRENPERLRELLVEMTWGNGFTDADYDRAVFGE